MKRLKRFEGIIIKLLVIQLCCLFIAQALILYTEVAPFLTKVVHYEGVDGMKILEHIETFDQKR
ncbi:YpfB family protein [Sutcliffiella halmapala]|uniref:YpfB family protein n=1 Tax=Sutcliffiella halmapala TaxID=79882 RepID=UPI001F2DB484|nr:YpfB family protein [Sutcliffiella halmapala]